MAPQNKKREASPDQRNNSNDEAACKRAKDDIKPEPQPDQTTATKEQLACNLTKNKQDLEETHNNNNSSSNGNNAQQKATTTTSASSSSSEAQEERKNSPALNGAKQAHATAGGDKVDSDDVVQDEAQDGEAGKSETNGTNRKETDATSNKQTSSTESTKTNAAADSKAKPADTPEPEEEPAGTLLFCGGANWDMTGRKELPKTAKKPVEVNPAARNLWGPHRVALDGSGTALRVKGVFSGCNACHSVIVTDEGIPMTFGRNDKGQLGLGDTETRTTPVVVEALKGINIVAAACGRSHTLFLSSDGIVFSCGDNKMGQCGTNQMAVQQITTPTRIAFKENKPVVKIACGAEFSMIVDIEGKLYSFGHPEHGQLGHNSEAKYFTSGNKYAFHCDYAPRRIVTFIEKSREGHVSPVDDVSIIDVACGTNHTLAVDKRHRCFSWGFAGYHRLGHSETKNELVPRSIKVFDSPNNSGRGAAKVFAGATYSMALDMNGLLYFWGQNKSSGEATMYPKNVQDLCGWKIQHVACANRSIFVIADEVCISWGPSPTYGELGYGEGKSKSSTTPQEVKTLEGVHVMGVTCGFGHTLLIARDSNPEDQEALKKLKSWP